MKKLSKNVQQKLVPEPFLILVNNPSKLISCLHKNFNIWNCKSLSTSTSNNFLCLITKRTRLQSNFSVKVKFKVKQKRHTDRSKNWNRHRNTQYLLRFDQSQTKSKKYKYISRQKDVFIHTGIFPITKLLLVNNSKNSILN